MASLSNSQIDRLGEQLKASAKSSLDIDVAGLDTYRLSFEHATDSVKRMLQSNGHTAFTQRPAKSTPSIIAKLERQPSARLSQIQDIAGLRLVVGNLIDQQVAFESILSLFKRSKVFDRRVNHSFGYRAVHIVVQVEGKSVEIQIRTQFQDYWAIVSEGLADNSGHALKYGGGDAAWRDSLMRLSDKIYERENQLRMINLTLSLSSIESEFKEMLAVFRPV